MLPEMTGVRRIGAVHLMFSLSSCSGWITGSRWVNYAVRAPLLRSQRPLL